MAVADGGATKSLQSHIEDMRSLTLCKICLKPFYEPYILACGHTYCYGCLRSWFGGSTQRGGKKNCPDCRQDVRSEPAPNYLLRDLAHLFVGRTELLPEEETLEQHVRDKQEEAGLLTTDRNGPGLFQGTFRRFTPVHLQGPVPIVDYEDGVSRCPNCAWEIEDGMCVGCNWMPEDDGVSLSEEDSDNMHDEEEHDFESSDDSEFMEGDHLVTGDLMRAPQLTSRQGDEHFWGPDDDHYDEDDDFIDNEIENDMDGMGDDSVYPTDPATPYSEDSSQDEEGPHVPGPRSNGPGVVLDSEDEDDVARPRRSIVHCIMDRMIDRPTFPAATSHARQAARSRRPVVISDDEEDDEDSEDEGSVLTHQAMVQPDFSEAEEDEDEQDVEPQYFHEVESDQGSEDGTTHDSSEGESAEKQQASHDSDEDSDDTVVAPQSHRDRRQRLQDHRYRRMQPSAVRVADLVTPPSRNYDRTQHNAARDRRRVGQPVY